MTIEQANNFYKNDTKKYEIEKNKEFLNWLKMKIDNGYHYSIEIGELQKLIDNIVHWYEFKYPERDLEYLEGITYNDFPNIRKIVLLMDVNQLLYRLPYNQLKIIECNYRTGCGGEYPVYYNDEIVKWKTQIFMHINRKNEEDNLLMKKVPYFFLRADNKTGEIIKNIEIEKYLDNDNPIYLEELLSLFTEKYTNILNFTELKECVLDHNNDIELRNRILQLVALKLLYSQNTTPERGYIRAKKFIKEFNKELGLMLSTEEIDELFNQDYTFEKIEDEQIVTYEDIKKNEEKGIKRFIKRILNNKN